MAVLDLFIAASVPVLKVLLVTALGSFLALDYVDILRDDARKHLNNLVFFVFNPALVGGNLANSVTYKSMVKMWFMPVNILITFVIGSALGWVVVRLTKTPPHLRGLVIGCCAAGNLGNMLLIIIPAVCKEKGSPFGDPDVCVTYGMAYASLSMAIGAIYLWSYVYNIVRVSSESVRSKEPLLSSSSATANEYALLCCSTTQSESQLSFKDKVKTVLRKMNAKRLFAPSTIGAIVGFTVGLVPQLRTSMIGDAAPLRVIESSVVLVGDGAVPAVTLILGGNLLKGLRGPIIEKYLIIGIVAARYIVMPLLGIVVVKGVIWLGLVHPDPLYHFVLLHQFALPPAINIGTMTQLFGAGESECSVIMLWTYGLASISLTIWSTLFMSIVSHHHNLQTLAV